MLEFLSQNWGSILVALLVLGLCGLALWKIISLRKKGGCAGCGGDCRGCCHSSNQCKMKNKTD